jgi:tetratricopeptide (TPR) repeat protein
VNIWTWVGDTMRELDENGQGRLALLMERLPSAVIDGDTAEVEAIVPEALALARALELPWVEIYLRHWHMQSIRGGFETLPQAVELLEFSHREEHVACPQSVCTVQDVAIAYADADGPGFAQERLAVTDETLARIDPSWPCFSCIIGEKVAALNDAGRHEEALDIAREGREAMAAAGQDDSERDYESRALLALGRAEEALEAARERPGEKDDTFARSHRQSRALALLALDRAAEARELHLPAEVALDEPKYQLSWARVAAGLVAAGELDNDWRLGALLDRMLSDQVERGRAWEGTELAELHARLALARGAPATAQRALEAMHGLVSRLREPGRAGDLLASVQAEVMGAPGPSVPLPEDSEAALAELREPKEAPDPERDVERLLAARRRWPDVLDFAGMLYSALRALGRHDEALATLRDFEAEHPDDGEALLTYGHALAETGAPEEIEAVAARLDSLDGDWLLARAAYARGDLATAREHARHVVDADGEALNARRLLATACESLGDFETALRHRDEVLAAVPDEESENDHWCRLIPATATGAWAAVRESGARLGMEFDADEGPVDEAWAYVRLRFDARDIVLGLRTGPVSARVLTVSAPDAPQHAGDLVVFEPSPIGSTEEGESHLFGVVSVLEDGPRRAYPFDGVYPGDDAWEAFVGSLREQGWVVDPRSSREYALEVEGEKRPAVFGYLAVPDDVEPAEAHERLGELTAGWQQPFTWLPLAEAAGADGAAAEQRAHTEAFALY